MTQSGPGVDVLAGWWSQLICAAQEKAKQEKATGAKREIAGGARHPAKVRPSAPAAGRMGCCLWAWTALLDGCT